MKSITDLYQRWVKLLEERQNDYTAYSAIACDLDMLAGEAWHQLTNPPTEADGDSFGSVLVCDDLAIHTVAWHKVPQWVRRKALWARIRDVVIMPYDIDMRYADDGLEKSG